MAGIKVDASKLLANLENAETKSQVAIRMFAQEGAKKFENYAKKNRPWVDRTGHARQRLTGWVEVLTNKVRIHIGHGVDYGYWLEKRRDFNGKYQILEKARDSEVNNFKNMLRNMF